MTRSASSQQESTLRDYAAVVRRRRLLVIAITVIVTATAVTLSLREQVLYQGSADVLLQRQDVGSSLTGITDPSSATQVDPQRFAQTQAQLATVPELAHQVLRATGFPNSSATDLLGRLSVTPAQNADILQFMVTEPDQALATRLTTAYAQQFTVYRQRLDNLSLTRAQADVSAELSRLAASGQRKSGLYSTLIGKQRQIQTLQALPSTSAVVVRPSASATQVQPRPTRNGLIGLGVGIILGILLAFLREALDTRIRSGDEIGAELDVPLLARIAKPQRRVRNDDGLVMLAEPHGRQSESFRMLRTNLEFVTLDRPAQVVMVTSALEGEGKSTTAANLAVALGRSGRRVLLIDLDLRRPYLHRFFGVDPEPGVTDVALRRATLDEAITAITVGDVDVTEHRRGANGNGLPEGVDGQIEFLPAGTLPPDAGDFVNSRALDEILSSLDGSADITLIDCPPLLHVGDALALSAKVDGLILVTRLGVLRRSALAELEQVLQTTRCPTLGHVLTGADEEDHADGSSYYYRGGRQRVLESLRSSERT